MAYYVAAISALYSYPFMVFAPVRADAKVLLRRVCSAQIRFGSSIIIESKICAVERGQGINKKGIDFRLLHGRKHHSKSGVTNCVKFQSLLTRFVSYLELLSGSINLSGGPCWAGEFHLDCQGRLGGEAAGNDRAYRRQGAPKL